DQESFWASHPILSLDEFCAVATGPKPSRHAAMRRLRYAVRRGRLTLVERGLYAVVPPGVHRFTPDRFLVAAALRQDAVLAYHSALDLLGLAHSVYRDVFYLTARQRKDIRLSSGRVRA